LTSKIEAGNYELTTEEINISELVTGCAAEFYQRFPKRKIHVNAGLEIYLTGDRLLLQMAINNLLDNALKYSGKEDGVEIILKKEVEQIQLIIKDEGKGIPDEEKKKVFNKFYRVGNLHTKEAKGTGLGLYLSKKILEQHGGNIIVTDNEPKGSIFKVEI
jgi:signal transduction histidine kinase